jgi:hypothetical protein
LRLADLPNFALHRLCRYETNLWRQAGQISYALEMLIAGNRKSDQPIFGLGANQPFERE